MKLIPVEHSEILIDIRQLIESARQRAASAVNAELTLLYWQVGRRIQKEVLHQQRGVYGKQIVATLAQQLTAAYGKGWSEKQLRHCLRIAEIFPDEAILSTLRRQLSWSHLKTVMYIAVKLTNALSAEKTHTQCTEATTYGKGQPQTGQLDIVQTVSGQLSASKIVQTVTAQFMSSKKSQTVSDQSQFIQTLAEKSPADPILQSSTAKSEIAQTVNGQFLQGGKSQTEFGKSQSIRSASSCHLIWSHYIPLPGIMNSGNATLLSGKRKNANREIDVPRRVRL